MIKESPMFKIMTQISLLWCLATLSLADQSISFSQAKKHMLKIYQDHPVTFYCNCDYTTVGKPAPKWDSCGFIPRKQAKRGSRIEWEHVMPAYQFGHNLACWQEGGRKACHKDTSFRAMEEDMHNLVPAIGEVNGDRSNYQYAIIDGEDRVYGACDAEVDFKAKQFEPTLTIQGDIARIYFYMADRHAVKLDPLQRRLFEQWSLQDPIDAWKRERNQRIAAIQGNRNPYVDE
jgi:deoxyribonuclease-1